MLPMIRQMLQINKFHSIRESSKEEGLKALVFHLTLLRGASVGGKETQSREEIT